MPKGVEHAIRGKGINWATAGFLSLFHLGAVAAFFVFNWQALIVSLALYWVAGSLGIGVGYHRLLTHRGYRVPKALEYFLTLCGALALQGGPGAWVATHRVHHAWADREGDPHSPRDGRWWSHVGWVYSGASLEHNAAALERFAPDLAKHPFHAWLTRWHYLPTIVLALLLLALGGWSFLLWGVFLRLVVAWHTTWLVNSATHIWGRRRFATRDDSRNNWWVALLSFGEGWHNNHHAHPAAARHGLAWYEIDLNWWAIQGLRAVGLVTDIKLVTLPEPTAQVKPNSEAEPGCERSLKKQFRSQPDT